MKKSYLIILSFLCAGIAAKAQEEKVDSLQLLEQRVSSLEESVKKAGNLKISGYVQAQYQYGEEFASLKVGDNAHEAGESFNRVGIRRGRIKFTYDKDIYTGVFQLDITEKGVGVKDVYFQAKDPWLGSSSALKIGVFDRTFGYEIAYSSSQRESPERSIVFQTLFPDERDLGASITLQAPKTSSWSILKLEASLVAGNGIKPETDNKRDFIGHLSASNNIGSSGTWGAGFSYYNGSVCSPTDTMYVMEDEKFVIDNVGKYSYTKREYFGIDARIAFETPIGFTKINAEYLWGTQPGAAGSSKSPNDATFAAFASTIGSKGLYARNFQGYYAMLVQDLGKSPFSIVVKYDYYDPNTKVKKNEVGASGSGTSKTDLASNTLGLGVIWRCSSSLKLTAYYEINQNEKTNNITNSENTLPYGNDRKDNVFTLRLQYKF